MSTSGSTRRRQGAVRLDRADSSHARLGDGGTRGDLPRAPPAKLAEAGCAPWALPASFRWRCSPLTRTLLTLRRYSRQSRRTPGRFSAFEEVPASLSSLFTGVRDGGGACAPGRGAGATHVVGVVAAAGR